MTVPECAASGRSCHFGPHGPGGSMQCEYCGEAMVQEAGPADYGTLALLAFVEAIAKYEGGTLNAHVMRFKAARAIKRYYETRHLPTRAAAAAVPEGWVVVPKRITEEMIKACPIIEEDRDVSGAWSALLAAAPAQPSENIK
jgi:hypothetical protein